MLTQATADEPAPSEGSKRAVMELDFLASLIGGGRFRHKGPASAAACAEGAAAAACRSCRRHLGGGDRFGGAGSEGGGGAGHRVAAAARPAAAAAAAGKGTRELEFGPTGAAGRYEAYRRGLEGLSLDGGCGGGGAGGGAEGEDLLELMDLAGS